MFTSIFQVVTEQPYPRGHGLLIMSACAQTSASTTVLTLSCPGALNTRVWDVLEREKPPLFHRTEDTISIMAGETRLDLIGHVLHHLAANDLISPEFVQEIFEHYPKECGQTEHWVATRALVSMTSQAESMNISDEEGVFEQATKRRKFNC